MTIARSYLDRVDSRRTACLAAAVTLLALGAPAAYAAGSGGAAASASPAASPASGGASTASGGAASPADALTIHGRGDGHGVGMPQDGALTLGRAGKSAAQILGTFYPGTTLATAPTADMHVAVWQASPAPAGAGQVTASPSVSPSAVASPAARRTVTPPKPAASPAAARTPATSASTASGTAAVSTDLVLPDGGRVYGTRGSVVVPAGGRVTVTVSGASWAARLVAEGGTRGDSLPLSHRVARFVSGDPDPGSTASPAPATPTPADTSSGAGQPGAGPADSPTAEPSTTGAGSQPSAVGGSGTAAPGVSGAPPAGAPARASAPGEAGAPPASYPSTRPEPGVPAPVATQQPGRAPTAHPSASGSRSHPASPSPSPSASSLTVSGADLRVAPSGPDGVTEVVATGRSYRGQILTAPGELVNDVPLESYLRGLGEVLDPSWPAAGLQSLVVAARTYALRDALGADDAADPQHVNICATDACQVYLGAGVEYPELTQAVLATRGEVLSWQGQLADTFYSASSGGETATPAEGFGAGSADLPYLVPVAYDTGGHDGWQRSIPLGQASTALGYAGSLQAIEVTARGPSGRVTAAVLHGSAGDVTTTGVALEAALDLPSTLFDTGSGIPVALAAGGVGTVLPPLVVAPAPPAAANPAPIIAGAQPVSGTGSAAVALVPLAESGLPLWLTPGAASTTALSLPASIDSTTPSRRSLPPWLVWLSVALVAGAGGCQLGWLLRRRIPRLTRPRPTYRSSPAPVPS